MKVPNQRQRITSDLYKLQTIFFKPGEQRKKFFTLSQPGSFFAGLAD
jgi:hypothetical protein